MSRTQRNNRESQYRKEYYNELRHQQEEDDKLDSKDKVIRTIGLLLVAVQLIISALFLFYIFQFGGVPQKYIILVGAALLILLLIDFGLQFIKNFANWIGKVLAVLVSVALLFAGSMISKGTSTLNKVAGNKTSTTKISIVVKTDSSYQTAEDLDGKKLATGGNSTSKYADATINDLRQIFTGEPDVKDYVDSVNAAKALMDSKVEAFILNEANRSDIEDEIKDFSTKTRILKSFTYEDQDDTPEDIAGADSFNVYISGIDIAGDVTQKSRSDVNIIVNVNTKTHTILLLTTPRDYYIEVPFAKGNYDKLTHMGIYGIDTSMQTLENLYNIKLDHYMRMNFTGFTNIIDQLGGVDVNSEYDFTTLHGNYHIKKGMNHLNGDQALGFARERYALPDGDFQRGRDQLEVIRAIIDKATSSTKLLSNYSNIMNSISNSFQTNMAKTDITSLVKEQLDKMPSWTVLKYDTKGTTASKLCYSYQGSARSVDLPNDKSIATAKKLFKDISAGKTYTQEQIDSMD